MTDIKIYAQTISDNALEQINQITAQPAFKNSKIRIMPDCHPGKGCVIGFTSNIADKIIPNIVGVDIGCGMLATKIDCQSLDLPKLDALIKEQIPSGRNVNLQEVSDFSLDNVRCLNKLNNNKNYLGRSLGSLGGGNHFIELDKEANGDIYLVIHTGSRNLGKQIAEYYQEEAALDCSYFKEEQELIKETISKLKEEGKQKEISKAIQQIKARFSDKSSIPEDLCFLSGEHKEDYLNDMRIAQKWAQLNRRLITEIIIEKMGWGIKDQFESIHNYIDDNNIVRKGAISAFKGQRVIIPLNMRDGTIIGVGKGNEDWNNSAPHGAGRLFSRIQAKNNISLGDFTKSMEGIYTSTANLQTIDEAPMAYKNADEIEKLIVPTVKITSIIKPIYNFKAEE